MIVDFFTPTAVSATVYENGYTLIEINTHNNDVSDLKEPKIDKIKLTEQIDAMLNDIHKENKVSDIKVEKMTLRKFFETVYVDFEVSYMMNNTNYSEPQTQIDHFYYIIGDVD